MRAIFPYQDLIAMRCITCNLIILIFLKLKAGIDTSLLVCSIFKVRLVPRVIASSLYL